MIHELLPFRCTSMRCPQSYATKEELDQHATEMHPRQECTICKKLIQVKYIERHITLYHDKLEKVVCHICGEEFMLKTYLKLHMQAEHENGEKPKCDICGKV